MFIVILKVVDLFFGHLEIGMHSFNIHCDAWTKIMKEEMCKWIIFQKNVACHFRKISGVRKKVCVCRTQVEQSTDLCSSHVKKNVKNRMNQKYKWKSLYIFIHLWIIECVERFVLLLIDISYVRNITKMELNGQQQWLTIWQSELTDFPISFENGFQKSKKSVFRMCSMHYFLLCIYAILLL